MQEQLDNLEHHFGGYQQQFEDLGFGKYQISANSVGWHDENRPTLRLPAGVGLQHAVDSANTAAYDRISGGLQESIGPVEALQIAHGLVRGAWQLGKCLQQSAPKGAVNLASPGRSRHILFGDATGGGHKFGFGRLFNGKTKFPWRWKKDKIMNAVSEVATNPSSRWVQQTGRPGALLTRAGDPVKWKVEGIFEGVRFRVIVQGNDIITAFPIK